MHDPEYLVPRGVHRAPCLSPDGDVMIYAVDHRHRLLRDSLTFVRSGDNPFAANHALWDRLEIEDPVAPAERLQAG